MSGGRVDRHWYALCERRLKKKKRKKDEANKKKEKRSKKMLCTPSVRDPEQGLRSGYAVLGTHDRRQWASHSRAQLENQPKKAGEAEFS